MKVLVLNSGSSSLKFQLFLMPEGKQLCSGIAERIGLETGKFTFRTYKDEIIIERPIPNHNVSLNLLADYLLNSETGIVQSADEIKLVGHRVVHGGQYFNSATEITPEVKNKISSLFSLAPLHNPANLEGIKIAEKIFPNAKQVAVFDTAFHQSIPEIAYRYALPLKFMDNFNIRVYGFHGTSHKYVSEKAHEYLKGECHKMITIHLGNGCSMTALKNGKSVDHSLGFSPINGLIMGTRSGDIDPSIIFHLADHYKYKLSEINTLLNSESGMKGLTGLSDLREIEKKASNGDKQCKLALLMNAYRIKKYIGSYIAALNGLDAIVFTGGIGENSVSMRKLICSEMDYLRIQIDQKKNDNNSKKIMEINSEKSSVKILVIPTNEELEIAKQSYQEIM